MDIRNGFKQLHELGEPVEGELALAEAYPITICALGELHSK